MNHYLGLEVGEQSISAVAIDSDGTVLASTSTSLTSNLEQSFTAQTLEDLLGKTIGILKSVSRDFKAKPSAIGICARSNSALAWNSDTLSPLLVTMGDQNRHASSLHSQLNSQQWKSTVAKPSERLPTPDPLEFQYSYLASQLGNNPGVRVGSINSWLLATLTQSTSSIMDHSEASNTGLFNIMTNQFDKLLCEEFTIPAALLPQLKSSNSYFGDVSYSDLDFLKGIPIHALLGNEQASLMGSGCTHTGETIASLEADISILSNTGSHPLTTIPNLSAIILWTQENREVTYGLRATAPSIGNSLEWMMTTFGLAPDLKTLENLAKTVRSSDQVTFVPFINRGEAESFQRQTAAILGGLDLSSTKGHIARALFESVAHVVASVTGEIQRAGSFSTHNLQLNGNLSQIHLLDQLVADQTNLTCRTYSQSAPYGVAMLAACALENLDITELRQNQSEQMTFTPSSNRRSAKSKSDRWDNYINKMGRS